MSHQHTPPSRAPLPGKRARLNQPQAEVEKDLIDLETPIKPVTKPPKPRDPRYSAPYSSTSAPLGPPSPGDINPEDLRYFLHHARVFIESYPSKPPGFLASPIQPDNVTTPPAHNIPAGDLARVRSFIDDSLENGDLSFLDPSFPPSINRNEDLDEKEGKAAEGKATAPETPARQLVLPPSRRSPPSLPRISALRISAPLETPSVGHLAQDLDGLRISPEKVDKTRESIKPRKLFAEQLAELEAAQKRRMSLHIGAGKKEERGIVGW